MISVILDNILNADSGARWGVWSFISYWLSDAFNAATWQFASGIVTIGLSWKESLGIVALGFFMISFVIAFNGLQAPNFN